MENPRNENLEKKFPVTTAKRKMKKEHCIVYETEE